MYMMQSKIIESIIALLPVADDGEIHGYISKTSGEKLHILMGELKTTLFDPASKEIEIAINALPWTKEDKIRGYLTRDTGNLWMTLVGRGKPEVKKDGKVLTLSEQVNHDIKAGKLEEVKKLIGGYCLSSTCITSESTPLITSIVEGKEDIFYYLLRSHADPKTPDYLRLTPLYYVIEYGTYDMAISLLIKGSGISLGSDNNVLSRGKSELETRIYGLAEKLGLITPNDSDNVSNEE